MKLVCRSCGYPYRPRKGMASRCPKCGTAPSKGDAYAALAVGVVVLIIVVMLAATGAFKQEKGKRRSKSEATPRRTFPAELRARHSGRPKHLHLLCLGPGPGSPRRPELRAFQSLEETRMAGARQVLKLARWANGAPHVQQSPFARRPRPAL